MAFNFPGDGKRACTYQHPNGGGCHRNEIDGMEYCLQHMPDDMLEEAEEVTGMSRCRHQFGAPDACRKFAVEHTEPPMCTTHGAGSRMTREVATRRGIEVSMAERLNDIMAANGELLLSPPAVGDPLTELLDLTAEIKAFKEVLRIMTIGLAADNKLRYSHSKAGEQIRIEVLLYERAVERLAKILIDVSKLKIDERLAGVEQQTATMLERALDAALEESGVGLDGIVNARRAFRRHLKVVQGELVK